MANPRRARSWTRTARDLGVEAGVGLLERGRGRDRAPVGRACPHCGTEGKIDMIDTPRVRAYLTCPSCAHEWETGRFDVHVR